MSLMLAAYIISEGGDYARYIIGFLGIFLPQSIVIAVWQSRGKKEKVRTLTLGIGLLAMTSIVLALLMQFGIMY